MIIMSESARSPVDMVLWKISSASLFWGREWKKRGFDGGVEKKERDMKEMEKKRNNVREEERKREIA